MKLYFRPNTRATRPRWMLEELGVPYELLTPEQFPGGSRDPAYLLIHPHGQIPALVDGDVTIFESTAICLYLADRYPERSLAPSIASLLRARYYQWIIYCPATIEPALGLVTQHTVTLPDEQRYAPIAEKARTRLDEAFGVLAAALGDSPFLLGNQFSTADIIVGANLRWADRSGLLTHPALRSYLERLMHRPAALRAFGS